MKRLVAIALLGLATSAAAPFQAVEAKEALPKTLTGRVVQVFNGEIDAYTGTTACVVYVQTKRGLLGVTGDYNECAASGAALRKLQGAEVTVYGRDLKLIRQKLTLRTLHSLREAAYFETTDLLDLLSQGEPVVRKNVSRQAPLGRPGGSSTSAVPCGSYERLCQDERQAVDEIGGLDDGFHSPSSIGNGPDDLDDYSGR